MTTAATETTASHASSCTAGADVLALRWWHGWERARQKYKPCDTLTARRRLPIATVAAMQAEDRFYRERQNNPPPQR